MFVRIELYSTVIVAHVAHGDAGHQFAATGFLLRALEHPLADDVQFCLGHRSVETQKQPVVVGRRIYSPSRSQTNVPKMAHSSSSWYQSLHDRASRAACLAMAFKLVKPAQNHWRKLNGSTLLPEVIAGVIFKDGTKLAA